MRYTARAARWVGESAEGTLLPDGRLEVEYPLGDTAWAVRHALQYGRDCEVLSPESVREEIVARLERVMASQGVVGS